MQSDGSDGSVIAIRGLLERTLGARAADFVVEPLDEADGRAVFEVDHDGAHVVLRGSSGVAQASALRWYLAHGCKLSVTWDNPYPVLPDRLPALGTHVETGLKHFYYLQPCTYSYTTAFWDWARWEREIDWMALHGINMPLAMTGQEAVWQRLFRRFGVAEEEIAKFLGGPAYLPFVFMGCTADWAGPLPQRWIDERAALGRRILERERALGMIPILGAFGGQVPAGTRVPEGDTRKIAWETWETLSLDPRSQLFSDMSDCFMNEQEDLFGSDHLYAIDPLVEQELPVGHDSDLADLASAIFAGMERADPKAKWVMMSWPFTYMREYWTADRVRAFLDAVPDDRMLILDLWAEHEPAADQLEHARSKPWLWCMLHNFGGRPGLYGKLSRVAAAGDELAARKGVGLGATTEAILLDPILYELLADVFWGGRIDDLDAWVRRWAGTRCAGAGAEEFATMAWGQLTRSVYDELDEPGAPASAVMSRPKVAPPWEPIPPPGLRGPSSSVPSSLLGAWRNLCRAAEWEPAGSPLERDLVDVGADILARLFYGHQRLAAAAFERGDRKGFEQETAEMSELLPDMDRLLACRPEYRLSTWLEQARSVSTTEEEAVLYERNARRLVTLWGDRTARLHDYSGRHWSGLIATFYQPRWTRWAEYLGRHLEHPELVDDGAFQDELSAWEDAWCERTEQLETESGEGASSLSLALLEKYEGRLIP
jgi:alpha-N-acetylglucosaminidase